MNEREPLLGIAVGKKGIGKTFETINIMNQYVRGDHSTGAVGRRVLIMDVNDEFGQYRGISPKDIPAFCHPSYPPEIRRIRIWREDGSGKMTLDEIANMLYYILEVYRGGLLLVEDMTRYVSDTLPNDLIGAICTQRHMDVDIIIHFQTIGKMANPKIWGNANYVRMHRCYDDVERHKHKFSGDTTSLFLLEALVNYQHDFENNIRFHAYLDKDYSKISGNFTALDFENAVRYYMESNYDKVMKNKLKERNLNGELKYKDAGQLSKMLLNSYMDNYYGN